MTSLLSRLHEPELVWRWQEWFGVGKLPEAPAPSNGNSNSHKQRASNDIPHVIRNRLWFRLFKVGSWIGEETFYFVFFPLWFWNFDTDSARLLYFIWALVMWVGQGGKELVAWPRPASPPVVILERQFIEEFGFPSSHAVVAAAVPLMTLVVLRPLCAVSLLSGGAAVLLWAALVCLSRIYMGVHTHLEILAGLAEGAGLLLVYFPLVGWVEPVLMSGPLWLYGPFLGLSLAMGWWYPKRDGVWDGAWSDTVGILSANVSLCLGCRAAIALDFVFPMEGCLIFQPTETPLLWWSLALCRVVVGYGLFFAVRVGLKALCRRAASRLTGVSVAALEEKKLLHVEFISKAVVYFALGWTVAFSVPLLHHIMGIQK